MKLDDSGTTRQRKMVDKRAADISLADHRATQADAGASVPGPDDQEEHLAEARRRHAATAIRPYGTYCLPPHVRRPGDTKEARRHLLATEVSEVSYGTAMYGSTEHARPLGVDVPGVFMRARGRPHDHDRNGLAEDTSFYPAMVLLVAHENIPKRRGTLNSVEQAPICRAMVRALGLGSGVGGVGSAPAGSLRGHVLAYDHAVAHRYNIDYGLVVTDHDVSERLQVQLTIPLLLSVPMENDPVYDLETTGPWTELLDDTEGTTGVWAVPLLFTVHQDEEPLSPTGHRVDEEELKRIEGMLVRRFQLGPYLPRTGGAR